MMELKAGVPAAFGEPVESHLPLARSASRKSAGWLGIDRDDGYQVAIKALLEVVR